MNPPTIFKEVYRILLFLDEAWHMCTSVVHWSLELSLSDSFLVWVFMPNPYFVASQLHHRPLFVWLLPIGAPPSLTQLKNTQFSSRPWGQHIPMTQKTKGQRPFCYLIALDIYSYIFPSLHAADDVPLRENQLFLHRIVCDQLRGVVWTGELGFFFLSHK